MQRVAEGEVIDGITSANIDMLTSNNQETITDFNVSLKRDIIMRKYTLMIVQSQQSDKNSLCELIYRLIL